MASINSCILEEKGITNNEIKKKRDWFSSRIETKKISYVKTLYRATFFCSINHALHLAKLRSSIDIDDLSHVHL